MNNKIYINGRFLAQEMTGVQRVATEIGIYLQKHYNDRVVFICPPLPIINPYKDEFNCIIIGKRVGYIWEQVELVKYLNKAKANVLLNFSNTAPILFSKNIVVIHDMAIKQNKEWFDWKFRAFYNVMFFFITKKAKKIITVSNFSKSEILKYYPDVPFNKVEAIHLASFMDSNLNTITKKSYFIAVNSLNLRKNIAVIIKAFKILEKEGYHLKIVGSSNEKVFGNNNFDQQLSNIEFLGNISDEDLYKNLLYAKGFINAAWYEGFGLPPLEAMSLMTPCILSDIPVYRELYNDTALFFNPEKPEELALKIRELAGMNEDNYNNLCKKSYLSTKNFTWQKTSQKYIAVIDGIINEK